MSRNPQKMPKCTYDISTCRCDVFPSFQVSNFLTTFWSCHKLWWTTQQWLYFVWTDVLKALSETCGHYRDAMKKSAETAAVINVYMGRSFQSPTCLAARSTFLHRGLCVIKYLQHVHFLVGGLHCVRTPSWDVSGWLGEFLVSGSGKNCNPTLEYIIILNTGRTTVV